MIAGIKRARRGSRNIQQSPEFNRAYKAWNNMLRRCLNPKCKGYPNYGGRGITVDPAWLDFDRFYADMGPMAEGMSIERDDVNGPYRKANCRYIPRGDQTKNRRNSVILEHDGRSMTLAEWARELGLQTSTLYVWIRKQGLSLQQVIAGERPAPRRQGRPVGRKTRLYELNGESRSLRQWSVVSGIPFHTLNGRLRRGLSLQEALTSKPKRGRPRKALA